MRARGLMVPNGGIKADGKLHRCDAEGPHGRGDGAYVLHLDGVPAGGIQNHRDGRGWENWRADVGRQLSPAEALANKARVEAMRRARDEDLARRHKAAAELAERVWRAAGAADGHGYLTAKGIKPHGARQIDADRLRELGGFVELSGPLLVVPVRGPDGQWCGLQLIDEDGGKRFLPGTAKAGAYFSLGGKPAGTLAIAEGFATAVSVHEATGWPVAVGFDADNLPPVAEALRAKLPEVRLVVAGDNDKSGKGQKAAAEAAQAVGGLVAVPNNLKDWNDVMVARGAEAVRAEIEAALATPAEAPAASAWPAPKALPDDLRPVAPFDFDMLPATLAPWVKDIVERVQCPPDYVGATVLTALGAVLGRKVGIRPQAQTDWTEVPNQWALVVGRPGVLKSPAMEAALTPLKRLAARAIEAHEAELAGYERDASVGKLRAEAAEKAARAKLAKDPSADVAGDLDVERPEAPTLRRYLANDTSAASLGELHRQNPNGLLVHRDEMVSLLKGLDRDDNADARGFYLTGWNGTSSHTFDRIGRGMNLTIPAVCLSMLGSTQPGRISEYIRAAVRGGSGDDGLIQRFGLLVWPDVSSGWRDVDRWPDSEARRAAHAVFERLDGLDPLTIGARLDEGDTLPYLRFDEAALAEFRQWREGFEARQRSGELHPALESHFAKYRKLVPTLALVCHLADGQSGPVGVPALLRALASAEYLETHARRAYASVIVPEVAGAKNIIERIRKGDLPGTLAARDIYRKGWGGLMEPDKVHDALRLLVDHDQLMERSIVTGGRAATVFEINPRALAA